MPNANIAIVHQADEYQATIDALNLLPTPVKLQPGVTAVVTPNWVTRKPPSSGAITGTAALRAVLHWIKRHKPGRLVVATGSGGAPTPEIMQVYGLQQVIEEEGIEFVDLNHGPFIEVELEHDQPSKTSLNRLRDEMGFLLSLAQLKVHEEATVTLGIKNIAMGWPPAEEHGFPKKNRGIHTDLHGFIAAMMQVVRPDVTVLSAIHSMIGTGPSQGKEVSGELVIAGDDFIATDVVGARLLGFKPQAAHYLYKLIKSGQGISDTKTMRFPGLDLATAEALFTSAAYDKQIVLDKPQS